MSFVSIYTEGFETGGLERFASIGGGTSISSTVRAEANGIYSVFTDDTAATILDLYEFQGSSNGNAKGLGFWFNFAAAGVYNNFYVTDAADTTKIRFWVNSASGGSLNVVDADGTTLQNSIVASAAGDWNFIEFWYEEGTSADWEVFANGVSKGSGSGANFLAGNTAKIKYQGSSTAGNEYYVDDVYLGECTTSADLKGGMDVFATVGDGSATTGGDTPDAGSFPNVQEIPKNDSNLASYNAPTGNTDEREAPTSIAVQTNLTGSVTDIDDDPDSPDGLWLDATGKSTLRTLMANPTGPPTVGAGLQEFRVLMRKSATGPAGATERIAPDVLTTQTNLAGSVSDIQDDPDSPDANWLTSTGSNCVMLAQFATPTGNPTTVANDQEFKVWVRKDASGGGDPLMTIEVHDSDGLHATLVTDTVVTSSAGALYTYTWDATGINTSDGATIAINIIGTKGGGGPNERNLEIGAVEWNCTYGGSEETPGYEIKLYENGSEVVAAGSATGTINDAGGDTVVSFTWDATELGTADGSLVECYVNQTDASPTRYIDIGAVEWNCKYPVAKPAESGWIEADSGIGEGPLNFEPRKRYYFDGSDEAGSGTNWNNPGSGFNGDESDFTWINDPNVNVLHGGGTNAPITGNTISQVRARWKYDLPNDIYDSIKIEWFTDSKAESLGTETISTDPGVPAWSGWTTLSVPTGGWTWQKVNNLELEITPAYTSGSGNAQFWMSEIEVIAPPATALNEIIALTTYIRTQYSGSGSTLTHSLYRGNDVDGVTELSLGNATASLADFFDLTENASIMPLITEHTRVGFGHPVNVDVDIDCTEIIGMVAHVPAFPSGDVKTIDELAIASVKTWDGIAKAALKEINGVLF